MIPQQLPALGGDAGESTRAEAFTASLNEFTEVGEGFDDESEIFICNRHALEVDLLEPGVSPSQRGEATFSFYFTATTCFKCLLEFRFR